MEAEAVTRQSRLPVPLRFWIWIRKPREPEETQFHGSCLEANLCVHGMNREASVFIQQDFMQENVLNLARGVAE